MLSLDGKPLKSNTPTSRDTEGRRVTQPCPHTRTAKTRMAPNEPVEVELKLLLPADARAALKRHRALQRLPSYRCAFVVSAVSGIVPILPRVSAPANASRQPETQNAGVWGANGRRVSQGRFRVVECGAFRLGFDGGLGGEAENMSLFTPVVPQVLARLRSFLRKTGIFF